MESNPLVPEIRDDLELAAKGMDGDRRSPKGGGVGGAAASQKTNATDACTALRSPSVGGSAETADRS